MATPDRIEHLLPNGDVLIVDATEFRPEVEEAFARLRDALDREADETYRRLREQQAA